jgi:sulfite reductase (NADPH) hemoprotein beta-component
MYAYTDFDRQFVHARAAQFRDQLQRHLAANCPTTTSGPAPAERLVCAAPRADAARGRALRRAERRQLRSAHRLADIARVHDRGYGHFTTRQNLQFNWIPLAQAPT